MFGFVRQWSLKECFFLYVHQADDKLHTSSVLCDLGGAAHSSANQELSFVQLATLKQITWLDVKKNEFLV